MLILSLYDVPSAAGLTVNVFLKASRNLLLKAIRNIVVTVATADHYLPFCSHERTLRPWP